MSLELRRPVNTDLGDLARICHEAFTDLATRHGFPSDFPTVEAAQGLLGGLLANEQVYSVGAFDGGAARGSNYLNMWGDAAAIGPISIDVPAQDHGIGRALMTDVVAHGQSQGFEMIRLCQDAFNMRSLALYAALGFDTKEPIAMVAPPEGARVDPAFRTATLADFPQMDVLCRSIYRISRRGEYEALSQFGIPIYVIDRGRITGYLIDSIAGHGVAESDDDLLALLAGAGANNPAARSFVPIRSGELYRRALAAGHRNVKVMNLMALGPYEEPRGSWLPSVFL